MKRWFVLLLVAVLCAAMTTGCLSAALAEALLASDGAESAEAARETEIDLGAEESAEAPTESPTAPEADASQYAYAVVVSEKAGVYAAIDDAEPSVELSAGDFVLAVEQDERTKRVKAAFNTERGAITGWMDDEALEALAGDALEAALDQIGANVLACYEDDLNYPLPTLACRFAAEATEPEAGGVEESEQKPTEVENREEKQTAVDNAEAQAVANDAPADAAAPSEAPVTAPPAQAPVSAPVQAPVSAPAQTQATTVQAAPATEPAPPSETEPVELPVEAASTKALTLEGEGECSVAAPDTPTEPTDFSIPESLTLGQKESYSLLTPALVPAGSATTFTWRSDKPKIVEADPNTGTLLARKKGKATIYATSANGIEKSCVVTVVKAPKAVTLNETSVVLMGGGQTFQLWATLTKKTGGTVYWFSSDASIASVSPSGLVTSQAPGTATVTATTFNNKTATCTVKVLDPSVPQPASVALPAAEYTIGVKQTLAFTPTMYGSAGDSLGTTEFSVTSDQPKKLRVNADGTVTGLKKGNYNVKVTAYNGVSTTAVVHVVKAPGKVALEPAQPVLGVGQTRQFTVSFPKGGVGTVSFASDNPGVVAVDGNGYFTGFSVGSAVITARTHNGKTAKVTVKVVKSPEYVGMNADYSLEYNRLTSTYTASYTKTLNPGESFQLACEVEYGASGDVAAYESANPAVATVSAGGLITAVAPGEANIIVTTTGGAKTLCRVTVTGGEPAVLWYEAAETTLTVGASAQVPALASSALTADELAAATYASGNADVLTVAQAADTGAWTITGVNPGETVLTARAGGLAASLKVTVLPAVPTATTPTFRLFAAYEYFNPDVKGCLPFTENNAKSVASVFENSSVSGLAYTTKVMGNPTKTALLSGISSFFAGATDVDVSVVYLCSHGHMTEAYDGYRMSLPGYDDSPSNANYYMTSQEIFNCVSRIRGNVVLILDSCYSGAFLQDMSGQLAAQGGRIAVMTAASDTRATYYNVKKTEKTVDFFTFFLLKGLGYNHRDKWWNSNAAGKRGAYPGYLAADASGNGDGIVTLGEFYDYASKSIAANIPSYMKKSWYWGDKTRVQVPRFYPGNLTDLVIYQPR